MCAAPARLATPSALILSAAALSRTVWRLRAPQPRSRRPWPKAQDGLLEMLNSEAETAPQAEAVALAPFLDGLRDRGIALGVATNDAEAPARAHLDAAGVTGQFDFIAGFDSGFGGKPAPGQLLGFCAATGLSADTVVMVGDSLHDLKAGRAAGMRTVGVLTGLANAHDLGPFADAVFPDIGHITAWLDRIAALDPA